jgi:hypothetical protein
VSESSRAYSADPADAYRLVIELIRLRPEMIANIWLQHRRSSDGSCTGCGSASGSVPFARCQYRGWASEALAGLPRLQQLRYAERAVQAPMAHRQRP